MFFDVFKREFGANGAEKKLGLFLALRDFRAFFRLIDDEEHAPSLAPHRRARAAGDACSPLSHLVASPHARRPR